MLNYLIVSCFLFAAPFTSSNEAGHKYMKCQEEAREESQKEDSFSLYIPTVIYLTPEQADIWPPQPVEITNEKEKKIIYQTFTI